jgi:hypothetical protein
MIRLLVICSILLCQVGCDDGVKKEQQVQKQLEKFERVDANVYEPQQELRQLEEEEKGVYEQLVKLRVDEQIRIKELTDKAKKLLGQRQKIVEKEKETIWKARQEFHGVEPLMKDISNSNVQQEWEKVKGIEENRYASYDELYTEYGQVLKEGSELYRVFSHSPLQMTEIENQIKKIDEKYKRVIELNDSFNNWTEQYYKEKHVLYEKMGGADEKLEAKK